MDSSMVLTCYRSNPVLAQFCSPSVKWIIMSSSVRLGVSCVRVVKPFTYARMLPVCFNSFKLNLTSYTTLSGKKAFLNSSQNYSHLLMVHVPFLISASLCLHHSMTFSERYNTTVLILFFSLLTRLYLK